MSPRSRVTCSTHLAREAPMTKFEMTEIRLCSLKIVIKLEISSRKTPEKSLKHWKASYISVSYLWVKKKVSREILKI